MRGIWGKNIVRDFLVLSVNRLCNGGIYQQGYTVRNQQSVTGLQKPVMVTELLLDHQYGKNLLLKHHI